jgi:hypothetical protein
MIEKKSLRARSGVLGLLLGALLLFAADRPASAALGEALNTNPTGWWWYFGVTPAQVSSLLTSNNARLVSIQVEQASPLLLTVAMVSNTGTYAKGWYWFYGLTPDQLSAQINTLNARIIALDVYVSGGQTLTASILLPNTGADGKAWWWYYNVTTDQIGTLLQQNNARLIDFRSYNNGTSTVYAVVMISNTGADASGWWYYFGVSGAQVGTFLSQNNAYLISIQPADANGGTFNVIMLPTPPTLEWWWYFGVDQPTLSDRLSQNGARLLDVKTYFPGGNRVFAAIMVNNSNAETTRVGNILRNGTSGETGMYLKYVNGPVLANLQENFQYDPASSIKIIVALHLMRQVDAGNVTLSQFIPTYQPPASGSCPVNNVVTGSETFGAALQAMLENSDNVRTRALIDKFGFAAINQTAQTVGMTSTNLAIYPGCGITNQMTLADASKAYEGIHNLTLLSKSSRDALYSHMPILAGDFTGVAGVVDPIVDQEAASLGLTAQQASSFKSQLNVQLHYKAGGDTWCTPNCLEYRAISGTAEIPTCGDTGLTTTAYTWGIFVDAATNPSADSTFGVADGEPLREPIHAALSHWAGCASLAVAPPAVPAMPPAALAGLGAALLGVGAYARARRRRRADVTPEA